jgi:hypothetical protein
LEEEGDLSRVFIYIVPDGTAQAMNPYPSCEGGRMYLLRDAEHQRAASRVKKATSRYARLEISRAFSVLDAPDLFLYSRIMHCLAVIAHP